MIVPLVHLDWSNVYLILITDIATITLPNANGLSQDAAMPVMPIVYFKMQQCQ